MEENRRTIEELISLYTLEDDLLDFYVEGITDKLILDNYTTYKKTGVKIIEINTIDFTGIEYDDLSVRTSNKDKLVALSRILTETPQVNTKVKCIIDKDFDGILCDIEVNDHLVRTDFCCIESYLLCRKIIQKFIDIGIRSFPHDTDFIIEQIGRVLRGLFIIRLINAKFSFNASLLKVENNFTVIKNSGVITFNFMEYLEKFIHGNKLGKHKKEILVFIKNIENELDKDVRNTMHGHDFIEILFLYINKVKISNGFKLPTFERAFISSIQPDFFEDYPFFKNLN